ncbi:CMGC/CLK protein kinase [Fomitiporia mediterranea MF3/22]|uniref:CMGC/CLK protein kinase n=1 Tax=Fomitiporia mediterranea (strain MF3/22) TaxID=694068 RepID=UPI0004408604|nr:CMGC/CLK protein kinase [Fomitiporia mediterranea MF3/22]EJD06631.1 CMGC/CLK protein kinase [Fomitiporia mediterranea MF3/22]
MMQAAIQQLPSSHYAPQLSHRAQYLPVRTAINGTVTRTAATNGLPIPVPTPPVSRKRKRPPANYSVSYSEVQEVDDDGKLREVIVIEDTPPPPATISPAYTTSTSNGAYSVSMQSPIYGAPVRTRARAAEEAQLLSASTSSSSGGITVPALKRRRREPELSKVVQAKKAASNTKYAQTQAANGRVWANGATTTTTVTNTQTEMTHPSCDDKEGHYIVQPDDIIYRRYRTVRLLGQGTFGKVVEAIDTQEQKKVAIKIIRAVPKYRDASKIEVRVLQKLKDRDPFNKNKCVHLLHWFDHRNHICLVTELFGMCVYDFLKANNFQPFPRRHIQDFARQLLGSVAFLHELKLVHTDLKPENILFAQNSFKTVSLPSSKVGGVEIPDESSSVDESAQRGAPPRQKRIVTNTDIRLIDFGSATFEDEYHSSVVSTRHYRAPEIILGLGWSYPCDAFSLGCILVEFYTGVAIFQTHDNLEHLAMMQAVMGVMPERFVRAGARCKPEYFKDGNKLNWPPKKVSRQSRRDVRATKSLRDIIPPIDIVNEHFLDLVARLLAFDPQDRISVRDALQHSYFNLNVPMEEY